MRPTILELIQTARVNDCVAAWAHTNCLLAMPRAAFTNGQFIEWLLSGALGDVLSADGLGEMYWNALTPCEQHAKRRRHMEMGLCGHFGFAV